MRGEAFLTSSYYTKRSITFYRGKQAVPLGQLPQAVPCSPSALRRYPQARPTPVPLKQYHCHREPIRRFADVDAPYGLHYRGCDPKLPESDVAKLPFSCIRNRYFIDLVSC